MKTMNSYNIIIKREKWRLWPLKGVLNKCVCVSVCARARVCVYECTVQAITWVAKWLLVENLTENKRLMNIFRLENSILWVAE